MYKQKIYFQIKSQRLEANNARRPTKRFVYASKPRQTLDSQWTLSMLAFININHNLLFPGIGCSILSHLEQEISSR